MPKISVEGGPSSSHADAEAAALAALQPEPEAGVLAEAVVTPDPGPGPDSTPPPNSGGSSDPDDDDGPVDYDAYPIRALRELVRHRGLPIAGSKAELVARLEEHDAEQAG